MSRPAALVLGLLLAACQVPNNTDYDVDAGMMMPVGGTGGMVAPPARPTPPPPDAAPVVVQQPPPRPMVDAAPPPVQQPPPRPVVDAAPPPVDAPIDVAPPPPAPPKQQNGTSCSSAAACASGFCVDNWCCERTCGVCETCAGGFTPGTCTAIVNDFDKDTCADVDTICLGSARCGRFDQQNPADGGGYRDLGGGSSPIAQGVVIGQTGRLVGVRVQAQCTGSLIVEIRGDAGFMPGNLTLASQAISGEDLLSTDGRLLVVFQSPAQVGAGQRLQVVFTTSAAGTCSVATSGNFYNPGSASQLRGSTWTVDDNSDVIFQTIVEP